MRDVVVGKWGMLQWEKRDVAVGNKKRMAAPVSGRERKRRRPGGETEVSRSYRKLIRLRRMEGNGHYHYSSMSYAIVL